MTNFTSDDITHELLQCPSCEIDVHTIPAEGVYNQALRSCPKCYFVWFMDLESEPRFEEEGEQ